jgi:hypothetical protein
VSVRMVSTLLGGEEVFGYGNRKRAENRTPIAGA